MESHLQNSKTIHKTNTRSDPKKHTNHPSCFFCIMDEPDSSSRQRLVAKCFKEMPLGDTKEQVLAISGLWNIAMTQPDNPEFPSLGIFECTAKLIDRAISDRVWLLRGQNIYIPYYAAHIIGSYTMNNAEFAEIAVQSGVISPLMELLRGKMSWVEQRVAVRALGHLGSHGRTFEAIAVHEVEIVKVAMEIASTCLDVVYSNFITVKRRNRVKYHCELLTRGHGGSEIEKRKAEEWACQLQCWSIYLLNCFACKERSIDLMTSKQDFLNELCAMRGGLNMNQNSPAGLGLIRTLCTTKGGRRSVGNSKGAVESLCNLSRSSDGWKYMAIESLLLILRDPDTRDLVIDIAVLFLADLVEMRSVGGIPRVGDLITQTLLRDYSRIKYGKMRLENDRTHRGLEEIWDLKVERRKREKMMSAEELRERKILVGKLKREGNKRFWSGEVEEAVMRYTEGLDLCPVEMRKERTVLYSNRSQCYLWLKDPDLAIRDATRALCLSSAERPHGKSLWRRSQAYDMKGLARESLMDCLRFINGRGANVENAARQTPYYAVSLINKQINATWVFAAAAKSKISGNHHQEEVRAKIE